LAAAHATERGWFLAYVVTVDSSTTLEFLARQARQNMETDIQASGMKQSVVLYLEGSLRASSTAR
jgi:hypothetical protein